MRFLAPTFLSSLIFTTLALSSPSAPSTRLRTIHQFPIGSWLENVAVRANGNLLVTLLTPSPDVWEVNPFTGAAEHIYTFPGATSVLGIAEYAPDAFALNVGNFSFETSQAIEGSFSVWSVDIGHRRGGGWHHGKGRGAKVEKITDIPEAVFLNGAASLPSNPRTVVSADSGTGVVYSLNTKTGAYTTAIEGVDAFKPAPGAPLALGVNGLQFRKGEPDKLYWTNSFKNGHFGRIAVDPRTGAQTGPIEVLLNRELYGSQDDFTFDREGNAWLVGLPSDTVVKLSGPKWKFSIAVNDTSVIVGPTAAKFGRTRRDAETLYVVTNGGLGAGLSQPMGGAVVAVDTARL